MAYTDYLLPNEDQVLGFTGAADTTGCGDAFSAGFVYATRIGRASRDAAILGRQEPTGPGVVRKAPA